MFYCAEVRFFLMDKLFGKRGGLVVCKVVSELEETAVVESEVFVVWVTKGTGGGEKTCGFTVDNLQVG